MKRSYFFIYFLTVAVSCNAMELSSAKAEFILSSVEGADRQQNKLHCIEEITVIKDPRRVRYVTKDCIVISNVGCNIVDLKTKKPQKINDYFLSSLQINKNKKIVLHHDHIVQIYDEVGVEKWTADAMRSFWSVASHPSEDVIFGCYGDQVNKMTKYNYVTNSFEDIPVINGKDYCHMIAMHPNKEIICIASRRGHIFIRDINNEITLTPETVNFTVPVGYCGFCRYSPDGSYIVAGNGKQLFIINPESKKKGKCSCLIPEKGEYFVNIAFHPHKSVLATLSDGVNMNTGQSSSKKQTVRYWDIKTKELIDTPLKLYDEASHDLDFSQDGYELIIALENKCVRVLVPFVVKEKCAYLLWMLNQLNLQQQEQEKLPQDIVYHWGNFLLETFKF